MEDCQPVDAREKDAADGPRGDYGSGQAAAPALPIPSTFLAPSAVARHTRDIAVSLGKEDVLVLNFWDYEIMNRESLVENWRVGIVGLPFNVDFFRNVLAKN